MIVDTIKWHQQCQSNFKKSIDDVRIKIKNLQEDLMKAEERYNFKEYQIIEAIKQGKEKFDDSRFLIKKRSEKGSSGK